MSVISKNSTMRKIKDLYKNLLLYSIHCLSNCYKKLNEKSTLSNSQGFEDFTPKIISDKDNYSDIIKYAVENPNTKNVALTGPYGSGKSSILKTFESKFIEYKYLNISLATFDEKEHELKEIEYCILKQLFYKVEQSKIPESRFKRIVNQKNVVIKAILIFLWLISLIYFFKPNLLNDIIIILVCDFYSKISNIIYTLYFFGGSIYFLYETMGFILNFKLTKFSFQDAVIQNGDDKKSINFESEIDEILYFFERNHFNIVFIEDLDRFKNTEIFIKLREINYLINNYDPIKNNRKITFIYAVQDDTFKENERAKFFDFIVPVIPVINYSNSSKELLDKIDFVKDKIPKHFIKQVSRYLSDKRTIVSINNEYKIYKNIIGDKLDNTKLLAMMIYKNIEPTDFDNLNSQKGYVYNVFNQLNIFNTEKTIRIDEKIKILESKNEKIFSEIPKNIKELRSFYIMRFYENQVDEFPEINSIKSIELNTKECSIIEILEDDNFNTFATINKKITFKYHTLHSINHSTLLSMTIPFSFSNLESDIGIYKERFENLVNKKRTNEFKKEIEKLVNEKQVLRTKKIKDIVTNDYFQKCLDSLKEKEIINLKEVIDGKEIIITQENTIHYFIQNIDLINYLIRYGHIDDSYSHYISYFYPGTITKEDNDFLKSFTNNNPLLYNFKLKEIESLFSDILKSDFNREEILNFSLLDYIFSRQDTDEQLEQIITLLSTIIEKPTIFIDEYLAYTISNNQKLFLKALCKYWNNPNQNIWEKIMSNFSDDKCIEYLNLLFSTLDFNTIKALNIRDNLSNYISKIKSLNSFIDIDTEIIAFIFETKIKFEDINNQGSNVIFDFIYDNNSYEINEKMIELITCRYSQNKFDLELLKTANYTTIKNTGATKLIKYIDLNIEFYIKTVFLKLDTNCNESEEIIIELLNDNYEDFGPELTIEIIIKNQTQIKDISKIEYSDLWTTLLQEDKIAISWDNLLHYFKEKEIFDDHLVNYLNIEHHYSFLSKSTINTDFDKDDTDFPTIFIKELAESDISIDSFSSLINSFPNTYPDASEVFNDISIEKIKVLIQNKTILLSLINYNFINNEFSDLLLIYLEINSKKFIDELETFNLDSSIIIKLIDSKVFSQIQKMLIIEHIPEAVLIENNDISIKVCHLLATNRKIKKMSIDLLRALITKSKSTEDKIRLFNIYQNNIDKSELKSIIHILGYPYSTIIEGKHRSFENNEFNREFINQRKKDFITNSNLVIKDNLIKVYTKRKTN